MSRKMRPVEKLQGYCGDGNAVIVEEFSDRWRRTSWRKRVSASWLRKLRSEGISHIAVRTAAGHNADFSVAELLQ